MMEDCIFCKIVNGEIPCDKVFEDDKLLAFHDINPIAEVHFMVIPKHHIESLAHVSHADTNLLGNLFSKIGMMAKSQGLDDGFRVIVNTGKIGCQEVYHLHVHVIGDSRPLGVILPRNR